MLTIDPSQKKLVAILMVILIGAVCVTVFRISPSGSPEPDEKSKSAPPAAEAVRASGEAPVRGISRNPFKAPDIYRFEELRKNEPAAGILGSAAAAGINVHALQQPVPPLGINLNIRPGSNPQMQQLNNTGSRITQIKPTYTLLAIIGGSGRLSAIIKPGDSEARVVNSGDILDGGYKVSKIETDRAVLTSGRDTIIVKKPKL